MKIKLVLYDVNHYSARMLKIHLEMEWVELGQVL